MLMLFDTGRPGLAMKTRLIWYGAPSVFSPAHAGTDFVSTYRVAAFDAYAKEAMRAIGADIADGTMMTQSMWEGAFDGLHYLRGSNDNWSGTVSKMVGLAIMNVIFPECSGK
jgi:hypothetical protein